MNNAGVYSSKHVITSDGTELTFAVNVAAPFIITSLLLPELVSSAQDNQQGDNGKSARSRIVVASSTSQCSNIRDWEDFYYKCERSYSAHAAYSESKLLDAMLTIEMADRLQNNPRTANIITCNCLDPGTGM
jgi:NAD(P)-dependent dehydrogenase (short-subunit alcohol dehydrogenase family)